MTASLPDDVQQVFDRFITTEYTTIDRAGHPITWPVTPYYRPGAGAIDLTTGIGYPKKARDAQANPRVSLLFSDPTASGLASPPAVLVQGDASAPDEIMTSFKGYEDQLRLIFERQPSGRFYSSNRLMRHLFDWYYMRLAMYITPRRIYWWERGDFTRAPHDIQLSEMTDVGPDH